MIAADRRTKTGKADEFVIGPLDVSNEIWPTVRWAETYRSIFAKQIAPALCGRWGTSAGFSFEAMRCGDNGR
jgi:hypothetical protein